MSETKQAISKLIDRLVANRDYAYATGYLESLMAELIDKYVPAEQRVFVQIEVLGRALETAIDNLERS